MDDVTAQGHVALGGLGVEAPATGGAGDQELGVATTAPQRPGTGRGVWERGEKGGGDFAVGGNG